MAPQGGGKRSRICVMLVMRPHLIRQGIRGLLEQTKEVAIVAEADSEDAAVTSAIERPPELVLVQPSFPDLDPISLTRRLRSVNGSQPIVVVLTRLRNVAADIQAALSEGIKGYLSTDVSSDDLVAALRAVRRGLTVLGPEANEALVQENKRSTPVPLDPASIMELTVREREVLDLVREGLTNKEITSRLGISIRTTEMHVAHLISKLGARSRSDLIVRTFHLSNGTHTRPTDSA